ncbi:hypothetical protein [Sinorhizobium terangae]|uniref:hypothetical protein n=1 Tax=Sinorhizobium terangae TaxID=110322 RepID=UPI001AED26BC|nr:hypothetical protein [Sinorhizobium terangae]
MPKTKTSVVSDMTRLNLARACCSRTLTAPAAFLEHDGLALQALSRHQIAGKRAPAIGSPVASSYFGRSERIVGEKACGNISISSNM